MSVTATFWRKDFADVPNSRMRPPSSTGSFSFLGSKVIPIPIFHGIPGIPPGSVQDFGSLSISNKSWRQGGSRVVPGFSPLRSFFPSAAGAEAMGWHRRSKSGSKGGVAKWIISVSAYWFTQLSMGFMGCIRKMWATSYLLKWDGPRTQVGVTPSNGNT